MWQGLAAVSMPMHPFHVVSCWHADTGLVPCRTQKWAACLVMPLLSCWSLLFGMPRLRWPSSQGSCTLEHHHFPGKATAQCVTKCHLRVLTSSMPTRGCLVITLLHVAVPHHEDTTAVFNNINAVLAHNTHTAPTHLSYMPTRCASPKTCTHGQQRQPQQSPIQLQT